MLGLIYRKTEEDSLEIPRSSSCQKFIAKVKSKKNKSEYSCSCDCGSHLPLVLRPVTASTPSMGRGHASHPIFLQIGKQGLLKSDSQDYTAPVPF